MPNKTLFIAVSTGQMLANVAPIINFGKKNDSVVWIESELAKKNKWADGATKVLTERKFKFIPSISVPNVNEPILLSNALETFIANKLINFNKIVAIANGGQKFTPIGLYAFLKKHLDKNPKIVYSNNRPANLLEVDMDFKITSLRFIENFMSLKEILECKGYKINNINSNAKEFWNINRLAIVPPSDEYPVENDKINSFHKKYYKRSQTERFIFYRPKFDNLKIIYGISSFNSWKNTVENFFKNRNNYHLEKLYYATNNLLGCDKLNTETISFNYESNDNIFCNSGINAEDVYFFISKIIEKEITKRISAITNPDNLNKIGPIFENVVLNRVSKYLNKNNGFNKIVVSAWANVKISKSASAIHDSELDVVLILCNGMLIHLEIKSYTAQIKDLDARISVLQKTTSNLAEMCIVAPLYTDFINEDWVKNILKFKHRVENTNRMIFIPFTLNNQNQNPIIDNQKCFVPYFEKALDDLINKYIP